MANMANEKVKMPEQPAKVRAGNFEEVTLGYTPEMAVEEAKRCLNCKHRPCVAGCPVNVYIPEFIGLVAEEKFEEAFETIRKTNFLPAVCGRVCPQESQCEKFCVRGIKGEPVGIGRLERFTADYAAKKSAELPAENVREISPADSAQKAAVVGSGPAGLTCAADLAKLGYKVTVFEALHVAGGVLVYGIPEFRLPKDIVKREVEELRALGVEIRTNTVVGRTFTVDELFEDGYSSVFIGSGAGLPNFMNIEGEALVGVYSANEFLTRVNLMKVYDNSYDTPARTSKSVAVVGGGNVAMDAARSALRLGADNVYIVYRRSLEELPAREEEVHHAAEEGIEFKLLCNPLKILGDEKGVVRGIECIRMELGEPDSSGRRRPVPREGSEFVLDVDTVIMAIGTSPNPLIKATTAGLETNKWGCLVADDNAATTREGVFAGGDAVTGAATVILAMGAGKTAAAAMHEYMKNLPGAKQ